MGNSEEIEVKAFGGTAISARREPGRSRSSPSRLRRGVFPILKTPGYAFCSRANMRFCSYSIGVS
jgi:hypothetical protein